MQSVQMFRKTKHVFNRFEKRLELEYQQATSTVLTILKTAKVLASRPWLTKFIIAASSLTTDRKVLKFCNKFVVTLLSYC